MKLLQFLDEGKTKTGILEDKYITEITCPIIEAFNDPEKFSSHDTHDVNEVKVLPPISPSKIICVGLNYMDHARELNMDLPEVPIIFIKPSTGVIGHLDPIIYPPSSKQVDYEAELAIIISKKAHEVKEEDVDDYIGGYTILNDITARDLQRKDVQWTRAKSFDTFCPIGPYIETQLDSSKQEISLKLNGEVKQNSNSKNMIFSANELVEFISEIMTLNPGDIIATGTPPGVGPMQIGDTVEAEVKQIGILKNFVEN